MSEITRRIRDLTDERAEIYIAARGRLTDAQRRRVADISTALDQLYADKRAEDAAAGRRDDEGLLLVREVGRSNSR